ncbi:polyketide synthase [Apiospora marii]|uniref:polyketide synthase n=1 Tax=Apiospora marii TaxID=335849 RepID=UPI0031303AF8
MAATFARGFPFHLTSVGTTPAETPGETPFGQTPGESPFAGSPPSSATSVSAADSEEGAPAVADPSAIVGLAFRLPGAKTIPELWDNVVAKKDLQRKMPEDRFNTNARYGYFLEDQTLKEFDNEFFHISRKEAEAMDPQQRLLLEVVYEALEDAGIPLESIRGSRTSVHVGSFTNDYGAMTTKDLEMYPKYNVTGVGNAVLSNRISYFFDLHGQSVTLDTACSSSLVCFHLGSQGLQHGEADIAIVAGSALHFDPNVYITMTDFSMLSTDGRCRTFDAAGSGYVRGEGVCAMVLKRRSSAEAAGDRIRALVRGTGSNHDGAKSGLTLPNGAAQAQLIRQTYKDAGLALSQTDYFECHGTGTKAGDPIEANAIGSVFAPSRDRPLYVGSIKSNLGHLEGASGLAGITKALLSVESGKILPNMHFNTPNPAIDFEGLKIKVATELIDWPATTQDVRRASVNSFGYGGSNAHVILENYKPTATSIPKQITSSKLAVAPQPRPYLVPLTAHNDKAAKKRVADILQYIQSGRESDITAADVAHSYSVRRTMHQSRSFAIGRDLESLAEYLENPKPVSKWTSPVGEAPRIGFVFTGQGAQWHAMGRQLLEESALFRQTVERCDRVLAKLPDRPEWTCKGELLKSAEDSRLGESLLSQPLCAALQLALVELLRAWGITPAAVVGHSSGEIAAAYAAGILSFENAIICAYYRGLYIGRIALAAVNSPTSLTLSGDEDAIVELQAKLDADKVFNRRLRVEQAFHSHHMDPLAPGFKDALSRTPGFQAEAAKVQMVSSVTARDSGARAMDAAYWAANMSGRVRFSDALAGILLNEDDEQNIDILVEIGAHPALKGPARDVAKSVGLELPYLASLDRNVPAFESLLSTAGQLFTLGYNVDLVAANSDHSIDASGHCSMTTAGTQLQNLPAYPWDHERHWADTRPIRDHRLRKTRHTLLGVQVPGSAKAQPLWRSYLRLSEIPWLADHVVDDKVLFPAAGFVSMALEAVADMVPADQTVGEFLLRDVVFKNALVLNSDEAGTEVLLQLQPLVTSAKSTSAEWYRFAVMSFGDHDLMVEHCHGQIQAKTAPAPRVAGPTTESFAQLQTRTSKRKNVDLYYSHLRQVGLNYGERFRLLSAPVESGDGFALGKLEFDPSQVVAYPGDACILHPTLLDAAFHTIFAAIASMSSQGLRESFVPTFIRHAAVSGHLLQQKGQKTTEVRRLWADCRTEMPGLRVAHNDLRLFSESASTSSSSSGGEDQLMVDLKGLEITALGNDTATPESQRAVFFNIRWQPLFSQLASRLRDPATTAGGVADVVDMFAHEVPDSAILYATPDAGSVRPVLASLGGAAGAQRRFRSFTPWMAVDDAEKKYLEATWPGLIDFAEPQEASYDLVVVKDTAPVSDVTSFLKPDGYLVAENVEIAQPNLKKVFSLRHLDCYQLADAATNTIAADEPLTVIVAQNASENTRAIVSNITSTYNGPVETIEFGQSHACHTAQVVALVNLDQDTFFHQGAVQEKLALQEMQSLVQGPAENVVWVTKDSTGDAVARPEQAIITGLMRTIRSENMDLRIATFDIDSLSGATADHTASRVLQVLTDCPGEDELAERDGLLVVPRLQTDTERNLKLPNAANRENRLEPFRGQGRNLALKIGKVGLLDTLAFDDDEDVADPALGDDEVEIEVRASALNFRDIAASIGIIDDYRLGDEAAGVVVSVGPNVNPAEFQPGDRVMHTRPGQGAHRSLVRAHKAYCQKVGDSMDFVTAASFSCVLMTAYYGLLDTARLQPGEYCLVHAAAGGVGQMAIQLAQMVGAKVIATVGSPEKRRFLTETFGIPDSMIFSSRDDSFVEGVMRVTGGRGCDVALNSLAGPLLHATWRCIAPLGRFLEIGKRDIHENTKLDMDPFRRNVSYASVDLITLYRLSRPVFSRVMRASYELVRDGRVQPPGPIQTMTYGQAQRAFRTLQIGKFFGKIVLVPVDDELVPVAPAMFRDVPLFHAEKSYLSVGGLGGIGRSLSEWMFRKGAREIAFLSRSGDKSTDAKETIQWLRERGVKTHVFQGDVSNRAHVDACIAALRPNLGGVFQAAMVLRDRPFGQMTAQDWTQCVHPKTVGTANLHAATEKLDLDFFTCFSSSSSVVGAAGQANYAAANAYLDALMRHRRNRGLAGTTMNVGAVGDVGAVAEDGGLGTILRRMGYDFISEDELLFQIEEAVTHSKRRASVVGRSGVDEHQVITGINTLRKDVYWASKPLFRNLYANLDLASDASHGKGTKSLSALLAAAGDVEERINVLTTAFIDKVAAVLGTPAESIQPSQPLTAYGLDSIVAVEFRKWFSTSASVDVPLFDILGAKSIRALTTKVNEKLRTEASAETTDKASSGSGAAAKTEGPASNKTDKKSRAPEYAIVPRSGEEPVPLSSYQTRMWFLHNMLEDKSALNFRDLTREADPTAAFDLSIERLRQVEIDIEEGESMNFCLYRLADADYRLALSAHHIAFDNGSTKTFIDQYMSLYDALKKGQDLSSVPAPRFSYADFTVWHNARLQDPEVLKDIAWWQDNLAGAPEASALLPFAQSQRVEGRSAERPSVHASVEPKILKRLKRVSAMAGATPFHFLIAAFRSFLFRYTEEEDLTFLMIDGNRPHPEVTDTMGFFVNMIPLRLQIAGGRGDAAFETVLAQSAQAVVAALEHNTAPFDSIVGALNLKRSSAHFPLGQIAVNYQMYGKPPARSTADFVMSDFAVQDIPTPCDLALEATEDPERGLELKLQYDAGLYAADAMARFLENFAVFLGGAARDHRQPMDEIAMCGPQELAYQEAHCWNTEVTPEPEAWAGKSIVSKILDITHSRPQATAIETSDRETISYADLTRRAERVAIEVERAGGRPGGLVGVMFPPGIDMVVAMLGVAFAGRGYVPLDPDFARERLRHMAAEAGLRLILVQPELAEQARGLAAAGCKIVEVSEEKDKPSHGVWLHRETATDNPFYVIYTSGSTGKPKGIVLSESNTRAMLISHNEHHRFSPDDRILFHSSMAFDLSVAQLWGALTSGATMLLAKRNVRKEPSALARFMREARVTVTYFPPTQFATVLSVGQDDLKQCSTYRDAIFAGEFLPPRVVRAIYDLGIQGLVISNQWGPSEATVQTSCHNPAYPAEDATNVPIGYGLPNCSHYIVDALLQPVPAGVIGEICQGGPQVSRGYMGRPAETARGFVQDVFAGPDYVAQGWTTMYRTGDRGRFLRDGQMECHGRIAGDTQVKLRGFRMDLAEVENEFYAAAKRLGSSVIVDVVVVPRALSPELSPDSKIAATDSMDERQLVAFLVTSREVVDNKARQDLVKQLHVAASEHLNPYMLPNAYHLATQLPSLSSGKHDRLELRTMKLDPVFPLLTGPTELPEEDRVDPQDERLQILASVTQVFRDVLKLDPKMHIEPSQSFFELGGHSVLALRVLAKVRTTSGLRIQPKDFFAAPTPAGVAAIVIKERGFEPLQWENAGAQVDWQAEAKLPETSEFYPSKLKTNNNGAKILLTGADSTVGLHMLVEILNKEPSATVIAMGTEEPLTKEALIADIEQHGLGDEKTLAERVEFLSGALSMPQLGLSADEFTGLRDSVKSIFHFGSRVSLLKPHSELEQVNLRATKDIIRLAAGAGPDTAIHYLSTWSVSHLQDWRTTHRLDHHSQQKDGADTIKTERAPDFFYPVGSDLAYFKTRWAAEMMMAQAAKRGIQTRIYRASALSAGDADATEESNFFAGLMRDIVQTGSVPDLGGDDGLDMDLVPPTYIARTIHQIVRKTETKTNQSGGVFHIRNRSPLSVRGLVGALHKMGKEARIVPAREWHRRIEKQGALYAAVAAEYVDMGHRIFSLDDSETRRLLDDGDDEGAAREELCEPVDDRFIQKVMSSLGM